MAYFDLGLKTFCLCLISLSVHCLNAKEPQYSVSWVATEQPNTLLPESSNSSTVLLVFLSLTHRSIVSCRLKASQTGFPSPCWWSCLDRSLDGAGKPSFPDGYSVGSYPPAKTCSLAKTSVLYHHAHCAIWSPYVLYVCHRSCRAIDLWD